MRRIYHTWDKWECYPAGFYEKKHPNRELDDETCRVMYAEFLADLPRFRAAMWRVIKEWPNSTEHYLTNENMNRLAWLGQAAMCIDSGTPSIFKGGFFRLTPEQQQLANGAALIMLNEWLDLRGEATITMAEAQSKTEANLY